MPWGIGGSLNGGPVGANSHLGEMLIPCSVCRSFIGFARLGFEPVLARICSAQAPLVPRPSMAMAGPVPVTGASLASMPMAPMAPMARASVSYCHGIAVRPSPRHSMCCLLRHPTRSHLKQCQSPSFWNWSSASKTHIWCANAKVSVCSLCGRIFPRQAFSLLRSCKTGAVLQAVLKEFLACGFSDSVPL